MSNFKDLVKELQTLEGELLLIGNIEDKILELIDKNKKVTETYYLNHNSSDENKTDSSSLSDVANNIYIKELHKYFKDGVDNIYCDYSEIKAYIPSFIRESLRITKKNIYITFLKEENYNFIEKKYQRYGLNCNLYSYDECNVLVIEANDIIVHSPKETYYYVKDNIEKLYYDISESI